MKFLLSIRRPLLLLHPGCETRCPGCAHRELDASESESQKENWLAHKLSSWKDSLEKIRVVSDERRWNYREKTTLAAELSNGSWKFGMRVPAPNWETEIIPIHQCPVHSHRIRTILELLSRDLPRDDFPLHYIAITGGLLTFVVKSTELNAVVENNLKSLMSQLPIEGAFINFNPSTGKRILASKGWKHIYGNPTAKNGNLVHGPESFQQLIPTLYANALEEARSFLAPGSGDLVLDLYSGLGASVHHWSEAGSEVIGVELMGEAIRHSRINHGESVVFYQGKVSERVVQLKENIASHRKKFPLGKIFVFTNPPRTGMEQEVTEWLNEEARPDRLVYLSCSAGTLARDLFTLSAYGVKRIIPYDFFPQTLHVETLACLELVSISRFTDSTSL